MKFYCDGVLLSDGAVTVSKACSSKSLIPALECIKISAYNDTVTMLAYDGELSIEKKLKAEILEEGEILVNGKYFTDFIGKISSYTVSVETDGSGIVIKYGDNATKILALPASDFPFVKKDKGTDYTEVKSKDLKELISKTVFCCATDESRPILKGCLLETKGDKLEATALDGFRLAVYECEKVGGTDMKIVCPARTLNEISRMISDEEETLQLFVSKNTLSIAVDDTVLTSRLYVGEFINKEKILPPAFVTEVKIKKDPFLSSLERASILNRGEKNSFVMFEISANGLRITANSEMGNVDETLEAELEGKELKIAVNGKFITEALKALDEDIVKISLNTPVAPFTIKNVNENKGLYLILPVTANN
jgi:DNA polymerase-3 subunit beta